MHINYYIHNIIVAHIRELEKNHVVIIDNVLPPSVLHYANLHATKLSIRMEHSDGNAIQVRRDVLLSIKECDPCDHGDAMIHCIKLLRGIPYILNKFHYSASAEYVVPRQCQLALYKRILKVEEEEEEDKEDCNNVNTTTTSDNNSTPTAAAAEGYVRHLDRCTLSISEMGLLGWLRASDYRHRVITAILYLNSPSWNSGGELRLFDYNNNNNNTATTSSIDDDASDGSDDNYLDILPTGGKLILFDSSKVEHQVLASHVGGEDRYALTCWFNGDLTPEKK